MIKLFPLLLLVLIAKQSFGQSTKELYADIIDQQKFGYTDSIQVLASIDTNLLFYSLRGILSDSTYLFPVTNINGASSPIIEIVGEDLISFFRDERNHKILVAPESFHGKMQDNFVRNSSDVKQIFMFTRPLIKQDFVIIYYAHLAYRGNRSGLSGSAGIVSYHYNHSTWRKGIQLAGGVW